MALSVVYFQIMHHLGRQHYVWEEYLYSVPVLEKVEVRVTVSVTVCVVLLCCVGWWWKEGRRWKTQCRLIACSSRKAPRGPPGLTSPSDGRIAINSTISGRVWNLIQKMYISTSPSPEVENFQIKIYNPTGHRIPDLLNQRQTCYYLSQRGELYLKSQNLLKQIEVWLNSSKPKAV